MAYRPFGVAFLLMVLVGTAMADAQPLRFESHTIAGDLPGGYQPTLVDLNRDGRLDVIALASRHDELAWFQNPGWQRHVMTLVNRPINLAAHDVDDDGIPELALAHEFGTTHEASLGILSLLTHDGDPTEPWTVREIDRTPTVHRLRWATIGATRRVLVTAPLSGAAATSPDFRDAVPVYWYDPDDWARRVLTDAGQGIVHGLAVEPWQGSERDAVFTASFIGVHVHRFVDGEWLRDRLVDGDPAPWPRSGASEITLGHLEGETYLATIEAWHGDQVVVYRDDGGSWVREVIDIVDSGHTIVTADFDGDGRDEIVSGGRGDVASLKLYVADDARGTSWRRQVLDDGGIATSGCAVADMDGDADLDLVCLGSSTANLKWYENVSP